ncbi:MAG: indolepyruvate ferredoxin oxidoreductase subunit alpha [Caldivirga sp.]
MANCTVRFMLGNHAVAHAALEAGVAVAAGYPGTPSSEIIEYIFEHAGETGTYVEWSSNEKVAFEVAYGAALAGARALVSMKHVGLNVAMDPLMSSAYTGVRNSLLIITADDPGMWSSQNEQDNRWVGLHSRIPVFEPYNPQNAADLVKLSMDFSSRLNHPVIMRLVTRVSHVREPVKVCGFGKPIFASGYVKDPAHHALVPANARLLKGELVKRWEEVKALVEDLPHEYVDDGSTLIITSGVAYRYVKEALEDLEVKASILNLVSPVPVPRKLIANAASKADKVIVVEEGDPVVEFQVKEALFDEGVRVPVYGKAEGLFTMVGELTLINVEEGIAKVLGVDTGRVVNHQQAVNAPPRPPVFCPGCPHAASFYELKIATAMARVKPVFSGDIGCYSLGINPPFNEQDLLTNMGSSIGLGMGVLRGTGGRQFIVAVIGDSTFFHAGLPALVDAVYNKAPMLIVVLDNRYTAMTGGQPSPTQVIDIGAVARAIGVKHVYTVDPFNVNEAKETLRDAIEKVKGGELAVVVMRRACALEAVRGRGALVVKYTVDADACRACGICYNLLACPAITRLNNGKAAIDQAACVGCSVCAQVCPYGAIKPLGEPSGWLSKWGEL